MAEIVTAGRRGPATTFTVTKSDSEALSLEYTVSLYVVVTTGLTMTEPFTETLPIPLSISAITALKVSHARVTSSPGWIVAGVAVKESILASRTPRPARQKSVNENENKTTRKKTEKPLPIGLLCTHIRIFLFLFLNQIVTITPTLFLTHNSSQER
ncbi:MAG: hypothetical protein KKA70_10465 [Proteobacteria bacterium]|nr:hypothetical protein [Pseudomonadota bacterium]